MRYVPTSIGSSRLNQNYNAVENPQIGKSLIPETKKIEQHNSECHRCAIENFKSIPRGFSSVDLYTVSVKKQHS